MAGQHPSRRQVLEALSLAAIAATGEGFSRWRWAFAQAPTHHTHSSAPPASAKRAASYQPVFFSPAQYRTVEVMAELILPATPSAALATAHHSSPSGRKAPLKAADAGATDAGVAEFIDFMVAQDKTQQEPFLTGLAWMDKAASGSGFVALTPPQQTALLDRIAYKKNFQPGEQPGQSFFLLIRKYTVMGFYSSRIGLESIDYPGLRFYAESPAVPQDAFLRSLGV